MIAIDASAFDRYLAGVRDRDTTLVAAAIRDRTAAISGVVATELLSNRDLSGGSRSIILTTPILKIRDGFWVRAGALRQQVAIQGKRAELADVLVAQTCIDYAIPLITYDRDYRHFAAAGLQLA